MGLFMALLSFHVVSAQLPPFPFGNSTNDAFTPPNFSDLAQRLTLPKPMAYLDGTAFYIQQHTGGYILLEGMSSKQVGFICIYLMQFDTSRGGKDQNQVWVRVGNETSDLTLARDIIAGNGTIFNPQAILVATWFNVEQFSQAAGAQNTFQLIVAWSDTGETWAIYTYSRLEYFAGTIGVSYTDKSGVPLRTLFTIRDNATMTAALGGSNCNRKGVYAIRINQGGPTKAPTNTPTVSPTTAPTLAPTRANCGLFGWSIFCPFTFCGIIGRWLSFCQNI